MEEKVSAYDFLALLDDYNLGVLSGDIKKLLEEGYEGRDLDLQLRDKPTYKSRFKANDARLAAGLPRLTPLQYLSLEKQYKDIATFYGIPEATYKTGEGGFDKFIEVDVSPDEFESRITTAQQRLQDVLPDVSKTLREFYPEVGTGDLIGYVLNPKATLPEIQKKITAAEITAAAKRAGVAPGAEKEIPGQRTRAEMLASAGVTGAKAAESFQTVAEVAPRGGFLADVYKTEGPYTQQTVEEEVFGLAGSSEARRKRQRLQALEQASFSAQSGMGQGALARDRAGSF
jgi:hypothetical protein